MQSKPQMIIDIYKKYIEIFCEILDKILTLFYLGDSMKNTKKVGFWSQVALTFFIVSGGAYGLEASVGAIGAGVRTN